MFHVKHSRGDGGTPRGGLVWCVFLAALAGAATALAPAGAGEPGAQTAAGEPTPGPPPGNLPPGKESPPPKSSGPATAPGHEPQPAEPKPLTLPEDARPPLCLIVDYLPAFAYEGEGLAYSFRVEKRPGLSAEPEFRVWWRLSDAAGKQLAAGEEKGAARENFTIVRGFLKLPEAGRRLEYGLESGAQALGSGRVEVVREADPWPAGAGAALPGLLGAGGERLILVLPERVVKQDDRFKPFKRLWKQGRPKPESVVVVGPRLAAPGEKSYLEVLGGGAGSKLKPLDLFPPPAEPQAKPVPPTRGIFALIEAVESRVAAAAKGADLVVLVMPQSDPEMGTDVRVYRQGLDWTISRLGRAGAKHVLVVPPVSRSVSGRQVAAYAAECAESARVYAERGAACLDSQRLLADKYWTPKGALGRVTGRFPNDAGQEALAEMIRDACK